MSEIDKPSKAEDEYFARQEFERRKQWAAERVSKMATEEKESAKKLHWMKCPKCGMDLATVDYQGVSIDRCTSCGGTYFDAGEFEEAMKRGGGFFHKVSSIFGP
jgi:hypothetical protein